MSPIQAHKQRALFLSSHCISHLPPCLCVSAHLITPTVSISSFFLSSRWKSLLNPGCIFPSASIIAIHRDSLQWPTTSPHRHHADSPAPPPPLSLSMHYEAAGELRYSGLFDVFNRHKDTNYPWDLQQSCIRAEMTPFASLCRCSEERLLCENKIESNVLTTQYRILQRRHDCAKAAWGLKKSRFNDRMEWTSSGAFAFSRHLQHRRKTRGWNEELLKAQLVIRCVGIQFDWNSFSLFIALTSNKSEEEE